MTPSRAGEYGVQQNSQVAQVLDRQMEKTIGVPGRHMLAFLPFHAQLMMEDPMLPSSPHRSCTGTLTYSWSQGPNQELIVEPIQRTSTHKAEDTVGDKCERLETIAYDDIGATSGAPLEFLYIQHQDELTQVSSITPSSAGSCSCNVIDIDPTRKRRDVRCVADAASFFVNRISGIMNDLVESIDPSVLEECKDRTRSMLSKSWGMALDDFSSPRLTRVSSSIFTNEKENQPIMQGAMTASPKSSVEKKTMKKKLKEVRTPRQAKEFHQRLHRIPQSSRPLHCSNVVHKQSHQPSIDKHQNIEVTEEDGIIDCNQLGQDVEISIHQNQYVLLSRDMATEVIQVSKDHDPSIPLLKSTDPMKALAHNTGFNDVVIVHSWKIGSPMSLRKALSKKKSKSFSGERFSQNPHAAFKHGRSRGSEKTVSTVNSEESSSTLQREETRWLRDKSSAQILDQ